MNNSTYSIGTAGIKWSSADKKMWRAKQQVKRSYHDEVLTGLLALNTQFNIEQYGTLHYTHGNYALYGVKTHNWDNNKKTVLITGGVHGYETSGVHGALAFIETEMANYSQFFNVVVAPCISPWGYETINRWNPEAIDPNRSFYNRSPAEESAALMRYIAALPKNTDIIAHIDLHETTDTDNSEFRPALAAREGIKQDNWNIPDGFYLVGNSVKPADDFQRAMITTVEKITHIAPADEDNKLIGVPLAQWGVINYPANKLGLCMGLTDAPFVTTTEVYPDSPLVDNKNCINAQVACITGGLEYLISQLA
jgi:hypothetical protein